MTSTKIHAEIKLRECKYFLDIIKKSIGEELLFYFSAFLSSWRSVLDILLIDAAIAFELNISREKFFSLNRYLDIAIKHDNYKALRFSKWWKQTWDELQKHPLYKERNYIIHRGSLEVPGPEYVDPYEIDLDDYYNYTASVRFRNTIIEYEPFSAHPEIPLLVFQV